MSLKESDLVLEGISSYIMVGLFLDLKTRSLAFFNNIKKWTGGVLVPFGMTPS